MTESPKENIVNTTQHILMTDFHKQINVITILIVFLLCLTLPHRQMIQLVRFLQHVFNITVYIFCPFYYCV